MGYLLALVFVILAATYFQDNTSGPIRDNQINGGIVAQQLIIQQAAASRVCTTAEACPVGTVLTPATLAATLGSYDNVTASGNFGNGDLVSFSTGQKVVSFFKTSGSSSYQRQVYGSAMSWLARNSPKANIRYVGTYSAMHGNMASGGSYGFNVLNADNTYTRVNCTSPAVSLAGNPGNIPDGAPMVATDLFSSSGSAVGSTGVSACS